MAGPRSRWRSRSGSCLPRCGSFASEAGAFRRDRTGSRVRSSRSPGACGVQALAPEPPGSRIGWARRSCSDAVRLGSGVPCTAGAGRRRRSRGASRTRGVQPGLAPRGHGVCSARSRYGRAGGAPGDARTRELARRQRQPRTRVPGTPRTPGALVDTAHLRFETGSLTNADVIRTIDRSCVVAVVAARQFLPRPDLLAGIGRRFAHVES